MLELRPILERLQPALPAFPPGHVWLVGAGPGNPGQLTLDALAGLAQADDVVYDALVGPGVLALAPKGAHLISAGKRGGQPSATQADVSHALIELARRGRRVLRLKGGDPFIFGRGGEEILALAEAGVPFRVIPGLTAGIAALAAASIPATLRGVNQAVVLMTGHGADHEEALDWAALAALRQPVVLYMAMHRLAPITEKLLACGVAPRTPAAVITDATLPGERILATTLEALPSAVREAKLEPPGIVVVGDIVATRLRIERLLARMEAAR